jgi:hypothetical protein
MIYECFGAEMDERSTAGETRGNPPQNAYKRKAEIRWHFPYGGLPPMLPGRTER